MFLAKNVKLFSKGFQFLPSLAVQPHQVFIHFRRRQIGKHNLNRKLFKIVFVNRYTPLIFAAIDWRPPFTVLVAYSPGRPLARPNYVFHCLRGPLSRNHHWPYALVAEREHGLQMPRSAWSHLLARGVIENRLRCEEEFPPLLTLQDWRPVPFGYPNLVAVIPPTSLFSGKVHPFSDVGPIAKNLNQLRMGERFTNAIYNTPPSPELFDPTDRLTANDSTKQLVHKLGYFGNDNAPNKLSGFLVVASRVPPRQAACGLPFGRPTRHVAHQALAGLVRFDLSVDGLFQECTAVSGDPRVVHAAVRMDPNQQALLFQQLDHVRPLLDLPAAATQLPQRQAASSKLTSLQVLYQAIEIFAGLLRVLACAADLAVRLRVEAEAIPLTVRHQHLVLLVQRRFASGAVIGYAQELAETQQIVKFKQVSGHSAGRYHYRVFSEGKPVGTPDAGAFWRVISEYGVKALFTAPTAFRAIKRVDPDAKLLGQYDLADFQTLFLAGERLDPETYHWATEKLGVPVIDHWWQTETGWPICANLRGLEPMPIKPGSPTVPVPGYDVQILDQSGNQLPAGQEGAIAIKLPLPPGTLPTLWEDDERYVSSYLSTYDGYYLTGDGGFIDEDGYVYVMGRTDDVINVAGHRLSTGAMEAVLAAHPAVAECAVIGVHDSLKGQLPRGFVVLKAGVEVQEDVLRDELIAAVRRDIGPVAAFRDVSIVAGLPNPLRQDPAQDNARNRRRQNRTGAIDHRRPSSPRRPPPNPAPLIQGQSS